MPLMTDQVLNLALDQAAVWRRAGRHLKVAVNLSARSLIDADLPASVSAILASHNLPPSALQLEITESVIMRTRPSTSQVAAFERAGVSLRR